jgi:hypothetical protein
MMFFVCGLSSKRKEVLINPDQVLYVSSAGFRRKKSALILTHSRRLIVDQDTQTVSRLFEEYLADVGAHAHHDNNHDDVNHADDGDTDEPDSSGWILNRH